MAFTDPLADMLTRIRNAQKIRADSVMTPASSLRAHVCEVLEREGYIKGFRTEKNERGGKQLVIDLKYHEGQPVIREIKRISKPGSRVYSNVKELRPIFNGLGISILSTPKGVLSDGEARQQNVGGEILCSVF
ncbi:MAG: 30S ribosomal protein S8 [Dongiaceae bacterium]